MNNLEYLEDRADEIMYQIAQLKDELEEIEDQMSIHWKEEKSQELSEYYKGVL